MFHFLICGLELKTVVHFETQRVMLFSLTGSSEPLWFLLARLSPAASRLVHFCFGFRCLSVDNMVVSSKHKSLIHKPISL